MSLCRSICRAGQLVTPVQAFVWVRGCAGQLGRAFSSTNRSNSLKNARLHWARQESFSVALHNRIFGLALLPCLLLLVASRMSHVWFLPGRLKSFPIECHVPRPDPRPSSLHRPIYLLFPSDDAAPRLEPPFRSEPSDPALPVLHRRFRNARVPLPESRPSVPVEDSPSFSPPILCGTPSFEGSCRATSVWTRMAAPFATASPLPNHGVRHGREDLVSASTTASQRVRDHRRTAGHVLLGEVGGGPGADTQGRGPIRGAHVRH
eukprot:scaffold24_cov341-Pavlova_lutheri.AAC.53